MTLYLDVSPSLPPDGLFTVGFEACAALPPSCPSSPWLPALACAPLVSPLALSS